MDLGRGYRGRGLGFGDTCLLESDEEEIERDECVAWGLHEREEEIGFRRDELARRVR